jgi:hypothetical protein
MDCRKFKFHQILELCQVGAQRISLRTVLFFSLEFPYFVSGIERIRNFVLLLFSSTSKEVPSTPIRSLVLPPSLNFYRSLVYFYTKER